ncbi:MAG: hypothetical protein ACREXR_18085 [Gammaproteobacteria bacterium]
MRRELTDMTLKRFRSGLLMLGLMLFATNVTADEAAFGQCIDDPMQGFLRLLATITVISLVLEHWIADFLFGGRLPHLRSAAVVLGKRLVPWVGAVILILLAIPVANSCLPLL